jgi:hypothetical protein
MAVQQSGGCRNPGSAPKAMPDGNCGQKADEKDLPGRGNTSDIAKIRFQISVILEFWRGPGVISREITKPDGRV